MKTAIITSKNEFGQIVNEGEAILLNCMDHQETRGFYEIRFVNGDNLTHCRWIDNDKIKNEVDM